MRARIEEIATASGRTFDDVFEIWNERAAIREFMGTARRDAAEKFALDDAESMLCSRGDLPSTHARTTPTVHAGTLRATADQRGRL